MFTTPEQRDFVTPEKKVKFPIPNTPTLPTVPTQPGPVALPRNRDTPVYQQPTVLVVPPEPTVPATPPATPNRAMVFTPTSAITTPSSIASSPSVFTPSSISIRNLPLTNFVTKNDEDEPPGLCSNESDDKDDLTDTSSATTPPLKPHVFAVKSIIPPSYTISFPPVETLIPMFSSDDDDNILSRPLNLDHNGKPLTYKTALQGPNSVSWIAANSAEFRRLIQKSKTMHPIMHDKIPADRKFDVTYYNPTTKERIINGVRTFRVRGVKMSDKAESISTTLFTKHSSPC